MVEAGADEVSEDEMLKAILFGHEEIKKIVEFQEDIIKQVGKTKMEFTEETVDSEIEKAVREFATNKMSEAIRTYEKLEREALIDKVKEDTLMHFQDVFPDSEKEIAEVLYDILKEEVRKMISYEGIRPDGRSHDEIRPISCEVGILPRTHGSGLLPEAKRKHLQLQHWVL